MQFDDLSAGAWVRTLSDLGYSMRGDPFSGDPVLGGYINALAIDPVTKTHSYSAKAYYLPIKDRPNLRVVTGAQVTRVILQSSIPGAEPSATGVEYTVNGGETLTAKARHGVILSAGAINTPKLLELSAIGSPAILKHFAIPVRVDNPHVGENLQDPVMAGVSFEVVDSYRSTTDDIARQVPEALDKAMRD
jgi:choline dehydrogenase-like flavoprotein